MRTASRFVALLPVLVALAQGSAVAKDTGIVETSRDIVRAVYVGPADLGLVDIVVETEPFAGDEMPMRTHVSFRQQPDCDATEAPPEFLRVDLVFTLGRLSALSAEGPYLEAPLAVDEATSERRMAAAARAIATFTRWRLIRANIRDPRGGSQRLFLFRDSLKVEIPGFFDSRTGLPVLVGGAF